MHIKKIIFLFFIFLNFLFADGGGEAPGIESADADIVSPIPRHDPITSTLVIEASQEAETEKTDLGFYSIQNSGLTVCNGDTWFFEKIDNEGKPIMSVLYEKDKLIEKKVYIYEDGYQSACEIFLLDKIIKIKYNKKKLETEKIIFDIEGKVELEKKIYTYDENNLLIETFLKKNGIEYVSQFVYDTENRKQFQTDFVSGNKVCFIEYQIDKKIVHLFDYGKEIGFVEEEL